MSVLRLRKFTPIDREYPIYEVVDEQDRVFFDVARTDETTYEVAFHEAVSGAVLPLDDVEQMIAKAKALLAAEEPS